MATKKTQKIDGSIYAKIEMSISSCIGCHFHVPNSADENCEASVNKLVGFSNKSDNQNSCVIGDADYIFIKQNERLSPSWTKK